jgi:hypothetical protein
MIKINWTLFRSAKYLRGVNSLGEKLRPSGFTGKVELIIASNIFKLIEPQFGLI